MKSDRIPFVKGLNMGDIVLIIFDKERAPDFTTGQVSIIDGDEVFIDAGKEHKIFRFNRITGESNMDKYLPNMMLKSCRSSGGNLARLADEQRFSLLLRNINPKEIADIDKALYALELWIAKYVGKTAIHI
jgi:hypothetical protein